MYKIFDTTIRDGAQAEDVKFSVEDMLRITKRLDDFGVHYIEGGCPASNSKVVEFFQRASKLKWKNAKLAAFGFTHHTDSSVESDENVIALLDANTPVVVIVGKAWDFHVKEALKISHKRNLELISNTVSYLKSKGKEVIFDAEHFFDGFKANPDYAIKCLKTAEEAGADCLVLCDTNGGTLPHELAEIIRKVQVEIKTSLGIHAHNDSDCAVANSLIAANLGVEHIQGTINGLGERCGNANLCSVIPALKLKMGSDCISKEKLAELKELSGFVYEVANLRRFKRQPYVGESAFAHKGGIHGSAILRHPKTYEHIEPELVGNTRKILASDHAGRAIIFQKAQEFNLPLEKKSPQAKMILDEMKKKEEEGYEYEAADGSLEILMRDALGKSQKFFELVSFRVIVEKRENDKEPISEATVKLRVNGEVEMAVGEGNGPVNALDTALRKALEKFYPQLKGVELVDYKVRILTAGMGTSAKTRVLIESGDNGNRWSTVGVSENIIEASWQALVDSLVYILIKKSEN